MKNVQILIPHLETFFNKTVYRYQVFQITPIQILGYLSEGNEILEPIFQILENGQNQSSIMKITYAKFYENELDAKMKQALDIHKMLNNSYKVETPREASTVEYYRRFIDENDLDFFISSVTNQQLHEEEYYSLLSHIAKDYPELVI